MTLVISLKTSFIHEGGKSNLTTLNFKDFHEMKLKAYLAAKAGSKLNYNAKWSHSYIDRYSPSTISWQWAEIIELYVGHNKGEISLTKAKERIGEIEAKYNHTQNALTNFFTFQSAMNQAFEESGEKFGNVEFECPICKGPAFGIRVNTPKSQSHKVTVRCGCSDCGYSMMN